MEILKVKWENITTILIAIFFLIANTRAFIQDGFDFNIFFLELVLDILVLFAWHYVTKNVRKAILEE